MASQTETNNKTMTILFVGDRGVGKTTYLWRYTTGEFEKRYVPTRCVCATSLNWSTNKGPVNVSVWDTAGGEVKLDSGDWKAAEGFVVFFDVTKRLSYQKSMAWISEIRRRHGDVPIVLVGNKVDVVAKRYRTPVGQRQGAKYYDVSAASNYNHEKPFLWLLRQKFGEELEFK